MRKCREWISLHFLSISSFSLHFLFIFSFSPFSCSQAARLPQFVQPWLAGTFLRGQWCPNLSKKMEFMKVTKMDVKADLLLVGWFFPLGESSRFSTRQLLCHKYAEGAAGNILFCQFHNTRGKHCRIPNTTSAIQQHLKRTTRGAKVSKMWNSRVCLVQWCSEETFCRP